MELYALKFSLCMVEYVNKDAKEKEEENDKEKKRTLCIYMFSVDGNP